MLSPKRKLFYALFALTPGTTLALFLNSVKNDMERENEALRLQHIEEELQSEVEREQKDVLLMSMIQDLRNRIHALEHEATEAQKQRARAAASATTNNATSSTSSNSAVAASAPTIATPAPVATAEWEAQKDAFLAPPAHARQDAQSGINSRVKQRERDMVRDDVRAYKAARAADAPTGE